LYQPVRRQPVAACEVIGDAGEGTAGVALGDLASHLLEEGNGRVFVGNRDAAVAHKIGDLRRRGESAVVALALLARNDGVRQIPSAGCEQTEQDKTGEPPGPARKGHGHGQRLNPLSNCGEIRNAQHCNEVPFA
jgi:hypothetical protein